MPAVTNAQIRRPVLRYHGGKWRLAPWIISHFPKHSAYVEPFGGGASVLMQKEPSREEVYNDLDGDIVNVFRVLRNPFKAYILEHLLSLTPYAREEFEGAYEEAVSDVEQARRTIIRAFMAQGSGGATRNDINGWRSRRVSSRWPVADWQSYPCEIPLFVERLRNVTIENRPAIDVIKRYDSTDTLIYADPPYLPETRTPDGQRAYRHEMTDEDHAELAQALHRAEGMVILSGYDSPMYQELYRGWEMVSKPSRATNHAARVECLWISPAAAERAVQGVLFEYQPRPPSRYFRVSAGSIWPQRPLASRPSPCARSIRSAARYCASTGRMCRFTRMCAN